MRSPRLEINLAAVEHNARSLVTRLSRRGIAVTGVTKATLGSPEIAAAMIRGGVKGIGDSRIENLEALREAGVKAQLTLLRAPDPASADRAVACADASFVSDLDVVAALSEAAGKRALTHRIVLMVELGDLREGMAAEDILEAARVVSRARHVVLAGIATSLAGRSGVVADDELMRQLAALAHGIGPKFGVDFPVVSGGSSASLQWALASDAVAGINDLRIGAAILLGVDPRTGEAIAGLRTDAFSLVGTVIESIAKSPWSGSVVQTIVALGSQDMELGGLTPPAGVAPLAASSDQLFLETPARVPAGTEMHFGVDYAALMRAMTSPFVVERLVSRTGDGN